MKNLIMAGLAIAAAFVLPLGVATAQSIVYQGPITITAGGTYTGNWQSTDPNTPAVKVRTTAPVTITNSNIQSEGTLIDVNQSGANVTVTNTNGYALIPPAGDHPGRFVDASGIASLVIEHNYFEGTEGNYVLQPQSGATIKIRYNSAKNVSGRVSTGSGWQTSDTGSEDMVQLAQFDKVAGVNAEISWNQVVNDPYISRPEDVINMYQSTGSASSPILIHDNYIHGSYPGNPDTDGFSGGGIIADSSSGGLQVYNNQVLETVNYGIAIAGGSNNNYYGNTVLGTGLLPDGVRAPAQNVGAYVNGSGSGNTVHDNTFGWNSASGGMNNTWFPNCPSGGCDYNNTRLSSISTSQVDAQLTVWQNKLSSAGVTVGPTGAVTAPAPTASLAANPTSIASGQSSTLSWNSTNASSCTGTGFTASGTSGSVGVSPAQTTAYSVNCGGATASATVTVSAAAPAPTASLTANPTALTNGQSSTLSWSSTNATSCSGSGFSASGTSGNTTVSPTQTTAYSVSCTGSGGSASATTTVTVSASAPAPTASLSANPASIASGSSTTLSWSSTNAVSCSGSGFSTGSATSGSTAVAPASDTTYSVTCTGSGGSATASAAVAVASVTPSPATFQIGATVTAIANLNVHSKANLKSSTLCTVPAGTSGVITGGPVSAQGYVWWNVNWGYAAGCDGWSVQDYLSLSSTPASSTFSIGMRVQTIAALNVRSKAGTSGGSKLLCTQPAGAPGSIIDGPQTASGYTWWNVNYDSGCDGWSAEVYLAPATTAAITNPNSQVAAAGLSLTDLLALKQKLETMLAQVEALIASATGQSR